MVANALQTAAGGVSDNIARELSTQIRCGAYAPGARLPTEKSLSEQFGVSRTVIREAISRLKSDGLVISRQGSGVFVTGIQARNSFKIDKAALDTRDVLQLLELRQSVEVSCARLAAARRTDDNIATIRQKHEEMAAAEAWSEDEVSADLGFHHAIAFASQNHYYADFMAFLGNILHDMVKTARLESHDPNIHKITLGEHDRILQAIVDRDPESAGHAMMSHLQGVRQRMRPGRTPSDL